MKKTLLMVMAALSMLFTQCRKTEPASPLAPAGDGQVSITLDVDGGNSKADVNTLSGVVTFKSDDVIYVASNGAYVGYLTYSDGTSRFEGTLTNPTEGQPLYFYFLGNKGPATANLATGTAELTADISDQSDGLPVISGAASDRNYTSDVTGYSARLLNKCALVKFDVQNYDGEGMVSITGMNNKVTVDLGSKIFSYIADETNNGKITLNHKSGSEYWAILLPQDAVSGGTASFSGGWSGVFGEVPEIECNAFLTNAIVIERYPVAGGETIEGSVTSNGAVVKYTIIDYPGHTLKEHGVEYSTNADMSESTKVPYLNSSKADYFVALTELAAGTKYYARVYAEYDDGQKTVYGNQIDFTTLDAPAYSCLCFTAEEANSTVSVYLYGTQSAPDLQTSPDGNTWTDYVFDGKTGTTITLANVGDKVYFRSKAEVTSFSTNTVNIAQFVMTGKIAASGSVMSLIDPKCKATEIPCDFCFYRLFQNCTSLTAAPALPATTLAANCYRSMFEGCTSLTEAPAELPATTLAANCYSYMFNGCTSLETAPELKAETLAESCCAYMFKGCTKLTAAPELFATTLVKSCYREMFNGCSNLNYIKVHFTNWGTGSGTSLPTYQWVKDVPKAGDFYCPKALNKTYSISKIPLTSADKWTVTTF